MPPNEPNIRAIADRMIALVHCVCSKAASDDEFAGQLKAILLSDELSPFLRPVKRKKPTREIFDPVGFLSRNGADRLREELEAMPLAVLVEVARKHRCANATALKLAKPDGIISGILGFAERKLNQGSVFLRSQPTVKDHGDEPTGPEKRSSQDPANFEAAMTESTSD